TISTAIPVVSSHSIAIRAVMSGTSDHDVDASANSGKHQGSKARGSASEENRGHARMYSPQRPMNIAIALVPNRPFSSNARVDATDTKNAVLSRKDTGGPREIC